MLAWSSILALIGSREDLIVFDQFFRLPRAAAKPSSDPGAQLAPVADEFGPVKDSLFEFGEVATDGFRPDPEARGYLVGVVSALQRRKEPHLEARYVVHVDAVNDLKHLSCRLLHRRPLPASARATPEEIT